MPRQTSVFRGHLSIRHNRLSSKTVLPVWCHTSAVPSRRTSSPRKSSHSLGRCASRNHPFDCRTWETGFRNASASKFTHEVSSAACCAIKKNSAKRARRCTGGPSGSGRPLRATTSRRYRPAHWQRRRLGPRAFSPAWNDSLDAGLVRMRRPWRTGHTLSIRRQGNNPRRHALADHHSAGQHDSFSTTGGNRMTGVAHQKVNAGHLKRNAYLYVRQSTLRQVFENTESTKRQYGLRQHAVALGWPVERIIVIDSDLGQSGASAVDREGFQKLVTEVSLGKAGIVLGLEVSRLARNSTDWHRLLEICARTDPLLLDEDGMYAPAHFNDRLLLGLKGTMSEAELHVLRARLRGGILNKAKRGELFIRPPLGLTYNPEGQCILDPDQQVQDSLRLLFATFRRTGSAMATVKAFRQQGLMFPRRLRSGPGKGELVWAPLEHTHVLRTLHNPRYAGA